MRQAWMIKGPVFLLLVWNAWQDCRKREIVPVSLCIFLAGGILVNMVYAYQTPGNIAGGLLIGAGMLLLSQLSRGAVGKGDGYLLCVAGLYLGMAETLALLLGGLLLCAAWALLLLALKRAEKNTDIPFIPFLLFAYLGELVL